MFTNRPPLFQSLAFTDLEKTHAQLSRTSYSWEELQTRPLPNGVDPARIEQYLAAEEFTDKFGITKEEYSASPRWKQIDMKKDVGLF